MTTTLPCRPGDQFELTALSPLEAELFDKYNLQTLPVLDDAGRMTGVITADDVISLLRSKL